MRPEPHPLLGAGVLYMEDFDDPPPPPARAPEPEFVSPGFSAEDLEAARQEAYADGMRDGQRAAREETAHSVRMILEKLAIGLKSVDQQLAADAEKVATELASCLLGAMCGSLPEFCRAHAEPETRALIRKIMPGLAREAKVDIRVHPSMVEPVQDEIAKLTQDLPEKLSVTGDPLMEPTDLRAKWNMGHLVRSSQKIWRDVRAELSSFGLLSTNFENEHAG